MQPQAITKVSISALVISLPIIYVSLLRVPPSTLARDSTFWFLMSNSIIAIIAADSGMLFLGSASHHDDDDDLSDVVTSEQQPVATVHEDYYLDAMSMPLTASSYESKVPVDISCVVVGGGEQLPTSGAASSKAEDSAGMEEGHALALMDGEEDGAGKPSTDMLVVNHAPVLERSEEALELEPISTNNNDAMILKGDQWIVPPVPLITVTPGDDVLPDEGSFEVVKTRCSVAEESKPPPPEEEEREYWQLSDEELNRKVEEFISRFNRDMIEQEAAAV